MRGRPLTPERSIGTAVLALVVAAAACGGAGSNEIDHGSSVPSIDPEGRTAAVVTTACGASSAAVGSAIRLDTTTVLTAAHVVAGAGSVAIVGGADLPMSREWPDFSPGVLFERGTRADVVAFDTDRDLALLAVEVDSADPIDRLSFERPGLGRPASGDPVEIHGAAAPSIDGTVAQRTTIEADEVRGKRRVERDGFRLDAATGRGDSGAGVWSTDDRLVGLVFAVSAADSTRTWAVSGREIGDFLDAAEAAPQQTFRCNEATSRLVADP